MKKSKMIVAKNSVELAEVMGLSPAHAAAWELKINLNDKIIQIVKKKGLTHEQVAKLAKTSRTRVTALMNRSSVDISTDLMLRILGALGYTAKLTIQKAA